MIILAWMIIAFTFMQFFVALTNLLFRPHYSNAPNTGTELVSVLIPARNEENNIGHLLNDLQNQNYTNIEIIVFNDQSSDNTENVVRQFTQVDHRIRLINSTGLPVGWLGKNYACHSLGNEARGNLYLFLDADVRLKKSLISKTVEYLKKYQLSLLSIFPHQKMISFGEKITVPNMNIILLTLLPLILVRKTKFASLSAANGQFMLFDANTYKTFQPHEKVKSNKVEDIQIAQIFKQQGLNIACHAGSTEISCRMYHNYNEAVNGFSKNVIMFFGNSFLAATLFWLITTFGFVVVLFFLPLKIFVIYLILLIFTRIFVALTSHQNLFQNIFLYPAQQISLGVFILVTAIKTHKKQFEWKGRNITS